WTPSPAATSSSTRVRGSLRTRRPEDSIAKMWPSALSASEPKRRAGAGSAPGGVTPSSPANSSTRAANRSSGVRVVRVLGVLRVLWVRGTLRVMSGRLRGFVGWDGDQGEHRPAVVPDQRRAAERRRLRTAEDGAAERAQAVGGAVGVGGREGG